MSMVMVCSRCREKEAMTQCEMCLEKGNVVKLCGDCFGPHYRMAHGVLANPEEEQKMLEHVKKAMGIGGLTIHDMRKAIMELRDRGEDPYWHTNYAERMKLLLESIRKRQGLKTALNASYGVYGSEKYQPNRKPTSDEMHSSVAERARFDMDSHPHEAVHSNGKKKKNNKKVGKARREADLDTVATYIREKLK